MGVPINNESTTTESPPKNSSLYLWGAKIAFYWYQIFALESAVVEVQKLTIVMYHYGQPISLN